MRRRWRAARGRRGVVAARMVAARPACWARARAPPSPPAARARARCRPSRAEMAALWRSRSARVLAPASTGRGARSHCPPFSPPRWPAESDDVEGSSPRACIVSNNHRARPLPAFSHAEMAALKLNTFGSASRRHLVEQRERALPLPALLARRDRRYARDHVRFEPARPHALDQRERALPLTSFSHAETAQLKLTASARRHAPASPEEASRASTARPCRTPTPPLWLNTRWSRRLHVPEQRRARCHCPPLLHAEMAALKLTTSGSARRLHLLEQLERAPTAAPRRRDGRVEGDHVRRDAARLPSRAARRGDPTFRRGRTRPSPC